MVTIWSHWWPEILWLPVQDGDGADDRQEVEDEVEGLRQRGVEGDEVENVGVAVGKHENLKSQIS